ncbi:Rpn family recombination-promoting nuclease/putative transposase [Methylomonas sp. AM2-LC]|uniref:Rpn family recombination-promoting nuclease/putative transposase n=1 Tax=Methylomonas sp. AM2-LC TaxID=3153301 RepID=UPI003266A10B
MHTDSLFYRLFQNWPQLALNMLQLPYAAESYRFVSEEIKQTGFRIDGIFKPLDTQLEQPIIFTEVQYQPDPDFYGRFISEIMLYLYRQKPGRRWLALVIYPTRNIEKPASIEFEALLSLPQLKRIYLEDYQYRPEPGYAMLRLLGCSVNDTVKVAQALLEQHDKLDKEVIEFIETVLVYKLPNLSREEIRIMLALNDVELKQTRFYQEIAAEERCEGKKEGKLEGKLEGECHLLIRQLNKRFGPLPQSALQKLEQAKIEQLELWGERILDAKSLAEVFE